MTRPRVRFAPISTGGLNIEDARTAVINWLFARSTGGVFMLKLSETSGDRPPDERDPPNAGNKTAVAADLQWLGLGWDEQAEERGEQGCGHPAEHPWLYTERARELIERGVAYRCFCVDPRSDGDDWVQREVGGIEICTGRCRTIPIAGAAAAGPRQPHALRLDVARATGGSGVVVFNDVARGAIRVPLAGLGDLLLQGPDGRPSRELRDVVDDISMGVTHTIRSETDLSGTALRVMLFAALGAARSPEFVHLPRITEPGEVLPAHRPGQRSIAWFHERGYPPEALLNYLALLGWTPDGGQELQTREELIANFRLEGVARTPACLDLPRLDRLSARHMARLDPGRLADLAVDHLVRVGVVNAPISGEIRVWVGRLISLYADRLPHLGQLVSEASLICDFSAADSLDDPDVRRTLTAPDSRRVIEAVASRLDPEALTAPVFQEMAEAVRRETGFKGRNLYQPMRVALTGRSSGPELLKLLRVIDEGSRLSLSRRVASCSERVRELLEATAGGGSGE